MTSNGNLTIGFDQKMIVPFFSQDLKGNFTKFVANFTFVLLSEELKSDLKYNLTILNWTQKGIEIKVDFENPMKVSRGKYRDYFHVRVLEKRLFFNRKFVQIEEEELRIPIPRQFPDGVDAGYFETQVKFWITFILIVCFIFSLLLRRMKDHLWFLILILQLVVSLPIYEALFPANAEIFLKYLRMVVMGELLNLDFFIRIFKPGHTAKSLIFGVNSAIVSGFVNNETDNLWLNLSSVLIIALFYAFFLAILLVFASLTKYKKIILDFAAAQKA